MKKSSELPFITANALILKHLHQGLKENGFEQQRKEQLYRKEKNLLSMKACRTLYLKLFEKILYFVWYRWKKILPECMLMLTPEMRAWLFKLDEETNFFNQLIYMHIPINENNFKVTYDTVLNIIVPRQKLEPQTVRGRKE